MGIEGSRETDQLHGQENHPRAKTGVEHGQLETSLCVQAVFHAVAAAAAAKSLQSCPTLCDLIAGSPPGSPIPGILQARILEWVAISFSNA